MNDLTDATRTDDGANVSNFTVGWKGGNSTTTITSAPSSSHGITLAEDQLEGGNDHGNNGNIMTLGGLSCGSLSAPDLQHFLMTTDR